MANLIGTAPNQVPANADLGSAAYINAEQLPVSDPQQSALDNKVTKVVSTDNAIVRFDGTTGSVQNSTAILDASGNLGLGVTPSAWGGGKALDLPTLSGVAGTGAIGFSASFNAYHDGSNWRYKGTTAARAFVMDSASHIWLTAPSGTAGNPITFTQAMTLDASGNLLVGTTSPFLSARMCLQTGGARGYGFNDTSAGAGTKAMVFGSGGAEVGSISIASTGTSYNTTSDYRLKENIQPMTGALDKISALKPVTYTWKADGSADRGFIAHELQEVIPQAVSGEKDAVDDEGNIQPQGVDYGKITPEIVAALQEAYAIITELKARIEQLENK